MTERASAHSDSLPITQDADNFTESEIQTKVVCPLWQSLNLRVEGRHVYQAPKPVSQIADTNSVVAVALEVGLAYWVNGVSGFQAKRPMSPNPHIRSIWTHVGKSSQQFGTLVSHLTCVGDDLVLVILVTTLGRPPLAS